MENQDFYSEENRRPEPWEKNTYQTGCTHPPRSHGGIIAVLLVLVIFLGGIASFLGLMNIRLLHAIGQKENPDEDSIVSFSSTNATDSPTTDTAETNSTTPTMDYEAVLDISNSPQSVSNTPQEGGLSLQEIYIKAIPSVVSISCTLRNGSSSGTGVVFSADGYIVTNCHVVADAETIAVQLSDGRELPAYVVGSDAISDLAVLYISADDLTPAEFGDSSSLRVGDTVVAIGDPLGAALRGTMTDGIISAINRDITTNGRTMTLIQTNAALNAGNSGGPLINCYGQVIGINTMKIGDYVNESGVEGLGFAIPSITVKEIVDQLVAQGYVSGRPTLGIAGETVSRFYQMYYQLPAGLILTEVDENSDAAAKGIQIGDVLISVDNTRITDSDTLNALLYSHQVGDTLQVVIYHSGKQYSLELTVTEANG